MNDLSVKELQFHYKKLPKNWAVLDRANFSISEDKLNTLSDKLVGVVENNKVLTLYIKDGVGLLVNKTFDKINYFGVDFKDYFDSTFNKENITYQTNADVVVIYNIGLEKALNTDFSARLLLGLLKTFKDQNKIVILASHLSYTDFYKKYQIDLVNTLSIPLKKEEKVF